MTTIPLSPLAAAARLAGRRGRVLLDSGRDDDGCGAWSFLAVDPVATLEVRGPHVIERDGDGRVVRDGIGDALEAIDAFARAHGAALGGGGGGGSGGAIGGATGGDGSVRKADDPRPRLFGFFGYDLGRAIEKLPPGPTRGADTPDVWLAAYDAVVRWPRGDVASASSNVSATGSSGPEASSAAPPSSSRFVEAAGEIIAVDARAAERLARAIEGGPAHVGTAPRIGALVPDDDGDAHCARVERIREYIAAGDVYQVNLARRLTAKIEQDGDALALYAALGAIAPAPYGGFLETDTGGAADTGGVTSGRGVRVISGSPERFLARAGVGQRLDTRPIKGTRRRTGDASRDAELAADLAVHPKDDAEHLMIVDLERNDLGRVAVIGSVRVDDLGYVVELPGLYHKVSTVSCLLRDGIGWAELLRATFPGGSITGAPKIRAMEIIDELEPARRGPSCGAIGWMGEHGAFALAISIRVAVLAGGELRLHVGGGIVADSDPRAELQETEDKAAGWRAALQRP
ncbi:MAG TPA: anthranilate synthase component I family protein [Kofleriaceae bacterium]|nr:anthranilate synthase component I family protein [Kofleriaceae bacterium]